MADVQIQKVRHSHEALIDLMLAKPRATQAELGAALGYTSVAIGIIMRSDAFRERLAQRRNETIDPVIRASFEQKLNALAEMSAEKLLQKAEHGLLSNQELLSAARLGVESKASKYGARPAVIPLVVVPGQIADPQAWAAQAAAAATAQFAGDTIEAGQEGSAVLPHTPDAG